MAFRAGNDPAFRLTATLSSKRHVRHDASTKAAIASSLVPLTSWVLLAACASSLADTPASGQSPTPGKLLN